jgi:hypothetical protein
MPIGRVHDGLHRFTGGELDLISVAFLGLLVLGIYQLSKDDIPAPPWYTAFWYAFGVFSKCLADELQKKVKSTQQTPES